MRVLNRCRSLHCIVGQTAKPAGGRFLESAEHGVWAIAEDLAAGADGAGSARLLEVLGQQVASGEDLTAALLGAHARLQRELGEGGYAGARVIAMRLNRATSSFEIAWVGEMQAFLLRQGEAVRLSAAAEQRDGLGQVRTNPLQMTAIRVPGLGRAERGRPIIDRKLGHAQPGDLLLLGARHVADAELQGALRDCLRGIWSLDYKLQRLQGRLQPLLTAPMPLLLWRAK